MKDRLRKRRRSLVMPAKYRRKRRLTGTLISFEINGQDITDAVRSVTTPVGPMPDLYKIVYRIGSPSTVTTTFYWCRTDSA